MVSNFPDYVDVTQDHIDHGLRGESMNCPVALALIDAGLQEPSVLPTDYGFDLMITVNEERKKYEYRQVLSKYGPKVLGWDVGYGDLEPFRLDLTKVRSV